MANYVVRVELHGATREDYAVLHEKMKLRGFHDVIQASDGIWYKMPPGEYYITGQLTNAGQSIRQTAHEIAASVRSNPGIMVTEALNVSWSNLPPA